MLSCDSLDKAFVEQEVIQSSAKMKSRAVIFGKERKLY